MIRKVSSYPGFKGIHPCFFLILISFFILIIALDFKANPIESQGLPELKGLIPAEAGGWREGENGEASTSHSFLGREFGALDPSQGSAKRRQH